jgi:glycosyltransferase involved in cell wall biosynthesis
LAGKGVRVDVVGSNEVDSLEMHSTPGITFHNFHPEWRHDVNMSQKVRRVLVLYARLLIYAFTAKPRLFHILWNNKVAWFDRTLLMLYLKSLRKRIALTAHNVNTAKRDGGDSWFNRFTLKAQYRLVDHVFVHTQAMRCELVSQFGVRPEAISVIPFGINNAVPRTPLTPAEAKQKLQVDGSERAFSSLAGFSPTRACSIWSKPWSRWFSRGGHAIV